MRIGSLFSGIGGLELGLEEAGLGHVAWQVEIDPYCRKVLEQHWPHVMRYEDVTRISGADLASVEVLCGGFPCQDVSSAGKGAGLEGARSGLWHEYRRLVGELRPRLIVVENVSSGKRRWLPFVRRDLETLGYATVALEIGAVDVGAPHRRLRVFVVAHANKHAVQHALAFDAKTAGARAPGNNAADAERPRHARSGAAESRGRAALAGSPWSDDAMPEPALRRVDDGLPAGVDRSRQRRRNQRLKALGNAVVPQCAREVGRWIIEQGWAREVVGGGCYVADCDQRVREANGTEARTE